MNLKIKVRQVLKIYQQSSLDEILIEEAFKDVPKQKLPIVISILEKIKGVNVTYKIVNGTPKRILVF